ncbi:uncharacterized protein TNIN_240711 [Trichonephila inaurata madagascariensis]|uniref:Uncharacterized protein n=1 Tax=Trichonephila inaurata madagascariensis TaxID=2747483 RepID=A0A8X6JT71_9ARAC|nr:uncharacterized protein TNIN_240711 [Trichonephila inaurata madagascariensis]
MSAYIDLSGISVTALVNGQRVMRLNPGNRNHGERRERERELYKSLPEFACSLQLLFFSCSRNFCSRPSRRVADIKQCESKQATNMSSCADSGRGESTPGDTDKIENETKEDAGRPSAASSSTVASILRRRMSWGRCPFLGHSFWDPSLEEAYQKYSHRQRRKSLVVVNLIDIILKVTWIVSDCMSGGIQAAFDLDLWLHVTPFLLFNFVLCFCTCCKCFSRNYLHWGALFTCLLLNLQGTFSLNSDFDKVISKMLLYFSPSKTTVSDIQQKVHGDSLSVTSLPPMFTCPLWVDVVGLRDLAQFEQNRNSGFIVCRGPATKIL